MSLFEQKEWKVVGIGSTKNIQIIDISLKKRKKIAKYLTKNNIH